MLLTACEDRVSDGQEVTVRAQRKEGPVGGGARARHEVLVGNDDREASSDRMRIVEISSDV